MGQRSMRSVEFPVVQSSTGRHPIRSIQWNDHPTPAFMQTLHGPLSGSRCGSNGQDQNDMDTVGMNIQHMPLKILSEQDPSSTGTMALGACTTALAFFPSNGSGQRPAGGSPKIIAEGVLDGKFSMERLPY